VIASVRQLIAAVWPAMRLGQSALVRAGLA
jgi:hypothetical protein